MLVFYKDYQKKSGNNLVMVFITLLLNTFPKYTAFFSELYLHE